MSPPSLGVAVPNVFVTDFDVSLAHYTGPLGFRALFVYGDVPFYAHVARDKAVLAFAACDKAGDRSYGRGGAVERVHRCIGRGCAACLAGGGWGADMAGAAGRALGYAKCHRERSGWEPDLFRVHVGEVARCCSMD